MTDMTKQTEADRLANQLDYHREYDLGVTHTGIDEQAAAELRRQQAEIERLNEALASVAKEQPAPSQYGSPELQAMIVARAMEKNAAEQPAPVAKPRKQEPVAWMYQCSADSSGPVLMQNKRDWAESSSGLWTETPLYKSPPASKPLTDKEIYKIANDLFYGNGPCDTLAMCRAIEAAHGITKEQT